MTSTCQFDFLRKTYPQFVFEDYKYDVQPDGLHIAFLFTIGEGIAFRPTAFIPNRPFLSFDHTEALDALVFNIGMMESISYWKCTCSPTFVVKPFRLSEAQQCYWNKLFWLGLGEFRYVNGIETEREGFVTFESPAVSGIPAPFSLPAQQGQRYLVPVGGGKDSVVTLEILRRHASETPIPLVLNPRGATTNCCAVAGFDEEHTLIIRRTLDKRLLELNDQGFLNGHTPFSAMLGAYCQLAQVLAGASAVALSNEGSANESTVLNTDINHQYSKSFEFENDFRQYAREFLSPDLRYFSFLRPLYELNIASLFGRLCEPYFDVFRSCNRGSKQDIWCGHCSKCLFAFIILAPFMPSMEEVSRIFGHNLLDDERLQLEFDQLLGVAPTKPFECVGTIEEATAALALIRSRFYADRAAEDLPVLLRRFIARQGYDLPDCTHLLALGPNHNLTTEEQNWLEEEIG